MIGGDSRPCAANGASAARSRHSSTTTSSHRGSNCPRSIVRRWCRRRSRGGGYTLSGLSGACRIVTRRAQVDPSDGASTLRSSSPPIERFDENAIGCGHSASTTPASRLDFCVPSAS
jgi:hypothetical protein